MFCYHHLKWVLFLLSRLLVKNLNMCKGMHKTGSGGAECNRNMDKVGAQSDYEKSAP